MRIFLFTVNLIHSSHYTSPIIETREWSTSQRSGSSALPLFDPEAMAAIEWQSEDPFEDPDGLLTLPEPLRSIENLHWARWVVREILAHMRRGA